MGESSLKEKTAKGLFWGGLSNFFQQIVGAIFGIAIARILSPGDYGLIGMLAIFIAISNTIMESGFTAALINKKEIKHEDYNAVFWFGALAGIVIYVLLFFSAPLIARFYDKPILIPLSRLLFLSILIASLGFAHNAILIKKLMVKERAKIDVTAVTISGAAGLLLALSGFAYWGLAVQAILMSAISISLRWYLAPWKPTFRHIDFKPLKSMLGFSSKLFLTSIFMQINSNIFSVLLGRFYGEKQVGYYAQGFKWMQLGSAVISGMVSSVAQPVFVVVNDDKERQRQVFRKMIRFGAFVSFPLMLGLAFIGREFILITVGKEWIESIPFLQIFCIYGAFSFIHTLYYILLTSFGKSSIIMWYTISISLLIIAIALFMINFGIFQMAIAYVFVSILGFFGWHIFARKLIDLQLTQVFKDILPYFIITVGCFFIAWAATLNIQNIYFLCASKVAISAIFYVLIMKYSRSTIFKESIKFFLNRIK
ncbi:lipopolysaccharide biosynthesis protein [Bacteroidia bacterium]|nr:lipopolysaccharide biosynthesis protein [Bacteroidia bacterium]